MGDKTQTVRVNKPAIDPRLFQQHALLFLFGFRLCNAFVLKTFFQPDEFYQALEPAWAFAFGTDQGAWITWVSAFACPM